MGVPTTTTPKQGDTLTITLQKILLKLGGSPALSDNADRAAKKILLATQATMPSTTYQGIYVATATALGAYCVLTANPSLPTGNPYTPTVYLRETTLFGYANAGAAGGQIQPQILGADGTYRDYGPLLAAGGQGALISISIRTPILGAQFLITNAFTGGSAWLQIDAAIY